MRHALGPVFGLLAATVGSSLASALLAVLLGR